MAQAIDTGARNRKHGHARDDIKMRTTNVLDDYGELRKDMGRLAGESANHVSGKVREYPAAATGLSLAAGLLLGMLFARR